MGLSGKTGWGAGNRVGGERRGQMGNSSWVSLQGQIEKLKQGPRKTQAISGISIQTASSTGQLLAAKDPSEVQALILVINTYGSC